MVGRLVEKQQFRLAEQDFRQFHAHLPAVAELVHLTQHVFMVETQSDEDTFGLAFCRMTSDEGETLVESTHPFTEFLIAIAFIISALREFILQLSQFFLNLMILLECRHRLLKNRLRGMDVLFLRQVADSDVIRHNHVAV